MNKNNTRQKNEGVQGDLKELRTCKVDAFDRIGRRRLICILQGYC